MGRGHLDPRLLAPELGRVCCCVLSHQRAAGLQQQQNDRGSVWCPQGRQVCLPGRGCRGRTGACFHLVCILPLSAFTASAVASGTFRRVATLMGVGAAEASALPLGL